MATSNNTVSITEPIFDNLNEAYDTLVLVTGTTTSGVTILAGVLTGVTYTPEKVIVYMEGQQNTSFNRNSPVDVEIWN